MSTAASCKDKQCQLIVRWLSEIIVTDEAQFFYEACFCHTKYAVTVLIEIFVVFLIISEYLNKYDWGIWKKAEPVYQQAMRPNP